MNCPTGLAAGNSYAQHASTVLTAADAIAATGENIACIFGILASTFSAVTEFTEMQDGNPEIGLAGIAVQAALCGVQAYVSRGTCSAGKGPRFTKIDAIVGGIGLAAGAAGGLFSFPEGTLIWAEDGLRPIEEIEVGDLVWSRDESDPDGNNVLNRVTETFNRITSDMNTLTLKVDINSNEPVLQLAAANDDHILQRVRLTPEHPVYVLNRNGQELGWTITADLAPGDLIADIDAGQAVKVVSNTLTQTQETVYNFEVEEAHSYFADELGLWVHNGRAPLQGPPTYWEWLKRHGKVGKNGVRIYGRFLYYLDRLHPNELECFKVKGPRRGRHQGAYDSRTGKKIPSKPGDPKRIPPAPYD